MARVEYGQTWWGKQWLNALAAVDRSNRLPRGRSYANNGSVKSFEVAANRISATVRGTRTYRVSIGIPAFSDEQTAEIMDRIADDPALISSLLNRNLDPRILSMAESIGIQVFPRRWNDFAMYCSCPDAAVPCKHLAAVVYVISREIDRSPFVVFEIHGLDLLAELGRRGIRIEEQVRISIPKTAELLTTKATDANESSAPDQEKYAALDFSDIEDLVEQLPRLLPARPLFYLRGDFREIYVKALKSAAKNVSKYFSHLNGSPAADDRFPDDRTDTPKDDHPTPSIAAHDSVTITVDGNLEIASINAGSCRKLDELSEALIRIEEKELFDYRDPVIALRTIYFLALNLVKHGAVVPQLVQTDEETYRVRWIPATINRSAEGAFRQVHALVPRGILFFRQEGRGKTRELPVVGESQTLALCSLFLTEIMKNWSGISNADVERSGEMFFKGKPWRALRREDQLTPETIQLWLNRFSLPHKDFAPALRVKDFEETGKALFGIEALVENKQKPFDAPIALCKFLSAREFQTIRFGVLKDLMMLAEYFPELGELVRDTRAQTLYFDSDRFAALFYEVLPIMRLFGIDLILPKSLKHLVRPQVSIKLKRSNAGTDRSFIRLDNLLDFDWRIAVGDESLDPEEFSRLVGELSGIVKLKGQYIYLNAEDLEKLRESLGKTHQIPKTELLQAALTEEYRGAFASLDAGLRESINELTEIPDVPLPADLKAELRPYQRRGFEWLYKNTQLGFGSLIADDMGLGKTLQVIAALLKFKQENRLAEERALVVVPTSLLTNWRKEIEKFAPTLTVGTYHGASRELQLEDNDVVLTTYGVVRSDAERFKKVKWFAVIVDEAQNIKNAETAQTKAIKSLKAGTFIAMSGTPVENRLSEYWSIMDFANRGYLGSLRKFNEVFAKPIQNERDRDSLERFKRATAPFLLRRLKSDKSVISDLPDKVESDQLCSLTKEQAAIYENTVKMALRTIEGTEENFARQGLVLQMILGLKQICNHPFQYLKKGPDSPEVSGKSVLMLSLLENIIDAGEKALIFTQYREMGDLLVKFIERRFGAETLFLHGGTSRKRRDEMVETFQNERANKIFVLSLKAGGTGLNLTAASNVIHYDLWWNPAVEAQATDRAYRIGQSRNVMVYRLITGNTFEERINEMIRSKRELAEMTVGTGETWIGNLPNKELRDIFELRND